MFSHHTRRHGNTKIISGFYLSQDNMFPNGNAYMLYKMQYKCSLRWILGGGSLEGRIPCIYIQGNGASCAKKVGTGLARQRSLGSAVFDGGFPPAVEEGYGSARVSRVAPGGGKGVEWNGMESSVVPAGRGGAEGLRGPKIDNAIPRLPLSPST